MRGEFWKRLAPALAGLTPMQQRLLVGYLHGEPVSALAGATGRTPHACSQALQRVWIRLRGAAERSGLTQRELRSYLGGLR
jgi:hypothetical protein